MLLDWYGSQRYVCAFMASDLILLVAALRSLIIAFIGAKLPKSAAKNTMATIRNKKALTAMVNELNGSRFSGLNIFLNHSRFKAIHNITIAKYTIVRNHSYHFLLSIMSSPIYGQAFCDLFFIQNRNAIVSTTPTGSESHVTPILSNSPVNM